MLRTVNAAKPATNATKPRMACEALASLPVPDQHPHRKGIRVSAQVRFDPAGIGNDPSRVIAKHMRAWHPGRAFHPYNIFQQRDK